jgi:CheY-like chemotaxis protein
LRILLADDSGVSRALIQSILAAHKHEVTAVSDGLEGWRLWQQSPYQVVVSDWMMPGMDGLELCRSIRAHKPVTQTYFILQTVRREGFTEALEAGVDAFIGKPVAPAELLARLETATQVLGT